MRHGIGRLIWLTAGTVGLAAGSLLCKQPARADITGYWVDPANWLVTTSSLTDIDQFRGTMPGVVGLPNDGKMYCAPTASMNTLAYLASHGYPKIFPGPKNWAASVNYNLMSNDLGILGMAMGTDAFNGTGGTGQVNGIKAAIAADAIHAADFTVNYIGSTPAHPNPVADAAKTLLQGAVACSVNGWYKWDPYHNVYVRKGGHVHTLQGASSPGLFSPATISIQDPAKDTTNNIYTQSPFSTETYDLADTSDDFGWTDNNNVFHSAGHLQKMVNYGGYLDGVCVVRALQGMTSDFNTLVLYAPVVLRGQTQPIVSRFISADGKPIRSLAMDPADTRHVYLTEGGNALFDIETLTGKQRRVAEVEGGRQVMIGDKNRDRFVLTGSQLLKFGQDGAIIGVLDLEFPIDQIAFDQHNNRLVGITFRRPETRAPMHDISIFDADTLRMVDAFNVGDRGLPPGPCAVSVNPRTGEAWFHTDGARFVRRLPSSRTDGGAIVALRGADVPLGLHVDEHGDFVLCDGSVMKVFMMDGSVRPGSKLKGLPAGRLIDTLRSFDNLDPLMDNNPAFYNVLPAVQR